MKITVIGLGHVGVVAAVALALSGHDVVATDRNRYTVDALKQGRPPFYEPGLPAWVASAMHSGNLTMAHMDEFDQGLGDVALIAVGTQATGEDAMGLRDVWSAISWIKGKHPHGSNLTIVMKSTVPPGTGALIVDDELEGTNFEYLANPEFLRQGQALSDWQYPSSIVIGLTHDDGQSADVVRSMYCAIDAPTVITDTTTAEIIKYASNASIATRISLMNEIALLCDATGGDVEQVSQALSMDHRHGSRVWAGAGYGGSCLPKDMRILEALSREYGSDGWLFKSVASINERQRRLPVQALRRRLGGTLNGRRIGVLGLAFKPGTSDVREAPALDLIGALAEEGAVVKAFDPWAMESARASLPGGVILACSLENASRDCHALVLMTEWEEIVSADWIEILGRMSPPHLFFDGRNALNPQAMRTAGFEYAGVGRSVEW